MNTGQQKRLQAVTAVIKAMAHPTRLYIVERLARKEQCVRELQRGIGADISTVSKHLSVLKGVGIVQDEKRGSQVYYKLRCPCALQFFGCVESVLNLNAAEHLNMARHCGRKGFSGKRLR